MPSLSLLEEREREAESQYLATFGTNKVWRKLHEAVGEDGGFAVRQVRCERQEAAMNQARHVPVDLPVTHVLLHSSSVSKRFLLPPQPPYQNWAQALACLS